MQSRFLDRSYERLTHRYLSGAWVGPHDIGLFPRGDLVARRAVHDQLKQLEGVDIYDVFGSIHLRRVLGSARGFRIGHSCRCADQGSGGDATLNDCIRQHYFDLWNAVTGHLGVPWELVRQPSADNCWAHLVAGRQLPRLCIKSAQHLAVSQLLSQDRLASLSRPPATYPPGDGEQTVARILGMALATGALSTPSQALLDLRSVMRSTSTTLLQALVLLRQASGQTVTELSQPEVLSWRVASLLCRTPTRSDGANHRRCQKRTGTCARGGEAVEDLSRLTSRLESQINQTVSLAINASGEMAMKHSYC